MDNRPKIGVGVLVLKGTQVLLGKRKNSHGDGTWQAPGGHLEWGEEPEVCARRELLEETNLSVAHFIRGPFTNDFFSSEQKHYVTLFMIAKYQDGIPRVMEPEKCEGWSWFEWEYLPAPLFLPLVNLLKQGFQPPVL
jgi:8-oxo-dGTP diphosphatase